MPIARRTLAIALLALGAACAPDTDLEPTAASTAALTGPTVVTLTSAQYPYFGRIYFGVGSGRDVAWYGCSGTLVGQDRVLTAAHCAVCATQARMYFGTPPADGQPPATYWSAEQISLHPVIGARVASGQINCAGNIATAHQAAGGAFDLAVVRLSTPVSPRIAVGLAPTQVYTQLSAPAGFAYMGQSVTHLGVGGSPFGVRRMGTAQLTSSLWTYAESGPHGASFAMVTPRTMSAAESGDSGGPILWSSPAGDRVVGITSLIGPDGNDHYAPTYSAGNATWLRWRLEPGFLVSCSVGHPCPPPPPDADDDGIVDAHDNCPNAWNAYQQASFCSP